MSTSSGTMSFPVIIPEIGIPEETPETPHRLPELDTLATHQVPGQSVPNR